MNQVEAYLITRKSEPSNGCRACVAKVPCSRGVNHGTFLHIAYEEGLIRNTSIHAGIRAPVARPKGDLRNDVRCGFEMVRAREIDRLGVSGVIEKLKSRVGKSKVYISVDIDVLDPAFAPGKFRFKCSAAPCESHRITMR